MAKSSSLSLSVHVTKSDKHKHNKQNKHNIKDDITIIITTVAAVIEVTTTTRMMMTTTTLLPVLLLVWKCVVRDFFHTLFTVPRTVSNTHAHVARAQFCANRVHTTLTTYPADILTQQKA